MKFTLEERLKIAKLHVDDGVPIYELSHQYDFSVSRIKYICTLYRRWGEKAFDKNTKRTTYTREAKLNAIHKVINEGISCNSLAIELMLTDPTIVKDWVRMYEEKGEEAIKDTRSREAYKHHDDKMLERNYKKLLEDLERTKAENEYLKKSYSLILKRSKRSKKK